MSSDQNNRASTIPPIGALVELQIEAFAYAMKTPLGALTFLQSNISATCQDLLLSNQ